MKRKFILLPITLTALAPAISLVGCGDEWQWKYGDNVNCRDTNESNYHKPIEVIKVAKNKVKKAESRDDYLESEINPILYASQDRGQEFFFNDLIASIVIINNDTINLKDWKIKTVEQPWTLDYYSFILNDVTYPKEEDSLFSYARNPNDKTDRTIYLVYRSNVDDQNGFMYKSYAYSECLWK